MWPCRKKGPNRSSGTRYIMKFMNHDRFTLAEFYDGAFTETLIDVRRENGEYFLESCTHHYNAKDTVTERVALVPFNTFDGFFAQLERFCGEFSPDKALLQKDYRLMCFLSLKEERT